MRKFLGLLAFAISLTLTPPAHAAETFVDTFATLDTATWNVPKGAGCVSVNRRQQLRLCLQQRPDGSIRLGRVDTLNSYAFTYGTLTARMRFSGPKGAHSALWAQTTEDYIVGQSEIDVAEHTGTSRVWHVVHWRAAGMGEGEFLTVRQATKRIDPTAWHTYSLTWLPDRYVYRIDGEIVEVIRQGLSDRPKMVVLSLLVSAYERPNLQVAALDQYVTLVDWVSVSPT